MDLLSPFLAYVLPVYLCVAIGVVWKKAGAPFDAALVGAIVRNIGLPCLIVATVAGVDVPAETLGRFIVDAFMLVCVLAAVGGGALALFPALGGVGGNAAPYEISGRLWDVVPPGLLTAYLAFGDRGLAFALLFLSVTVLLSAVFAAPHAIAEPGRSGVFAGRRPSLRPLLRSPIFFAVVIALLLKSTGVGLPRFAVNTTALLGGVAIPTLLVTLGVRLAGARLSCSVPGLAVSLFRVAACVALGVAAASIFDIPVAAKAALVLMSAMPFGPVVAALIPGNPHAPPGRDDLGAVSHIAALLALPILLPFVL